MRRKIVKFKLKTIIILISSILLFVMLLSIRFFTDKFGAPPLYWEYKKDSMYFEYDYGNDKGKCMMITGSDKYEDMAIKYAKYCDDLYVAMIKIKSPSFDYLSYLKDNKIKFLLLDNKLDDWSSLEEFTMLESFSSINSNFKDMSFLTNNANLSTVTISSSENLNYNDIEKLVSVESLSLSVHKIDISEIIKLPNLVELHLESLDYELLNMDLINKVTKLKRINFSLLNNTEQYIEPLSKSKSIDEIHFEKCNFTKSESEVKFMISEMIDNNVEVSFKDCYYSVG